MTQGQHGPAIAAFALLLAAGCSSSVNVAAPPLAFDSDASVIQVVSTKIGGKNVFIPSTIVVTGGQPHALSIFNTTDTPHGFRIEGAGVEAVLPSQEEHRVELPALEGGRIYRIQCHLHPPHRTATLVVMPGN